MVRTGSDQRLRTRGAHDPRAGDLVVPRLFFGVERDPEETESRGREGQEASERADDDGRPIQFAAVGPHDLEPEDDRAYGRAAQFPEHGAIGRQPQQDLL